MKKDPRTDLYHCPRCHRGYATEQILQDHLKKHPDFDPALHNEEDI